MKLDNRLVHEFLLEQGITHLFHANTVGTACTFLNEGGLISRGGVESIGLFQTPQSSDSDDKKFDVWNDIFLDSIDLHGHFPRYNFYGPVLFKINIDILLNSSTPDIYVTKDNPIHWKSNRDISENYFQSMEDFEKTYRRGSYKEMITLKDTQYTLYFGNYLEEVILDNPKTRRTFSNGEASIDLYDEARNILNSCIRNSNYTYNNVKFKKRANCSNRCFCYTNYSNTSANDLKRLFLDVSPSVSRL